MTRADKYHQAVRRIAPGFWRMGRSLAGKFYLPVEPASQTTARADAHNAEAVDSKLPKAEASSAAGHLQKLEVRSEKLEAAIPTPSSKLLAPNSKLPTPTRAKLGLRYER